MTLQVDFYVLKSSDEQSRLRTVCRLADKVQRLGHKIHVLTVDASQSKKLDDLMWTFSQSSFLPHAIFSDTDKHQDQQAVLIHHEKMNQPSEILINLQANPVAGDDYLRLVEIVNQDTSIRAAGRDKYRAYKDRSYNIKTHNLAA